MVSVLIFATFAGFTQYLLVTYSSQICYHNNNERSTSNFWTSEFYQYMFGKSEQVSIQLL